MQRGSPSQRPRITAQPEPVQTPGAVAVEPKWPDKVKLSDMADNPDNPPSRLEPQKLEELAASIRESGLLQRIILVPRDIWLQARPEHDRPVEDGGIGDKPWVIGMGHRRRYACELAGMVEALVDVRETADKARRDALIENIQRLNLPPLDEARQIQKLMDEEALSQNGVAKALGKSPGWVSQRLALLGLRPELQEALLGGDLKLEDARRLGKLPVEQQVWPEPVPDPTPAAAQPDPPAAGGVATSGGGAIPQPAPAPAAGRNIDPAPRGESAGGTGDEVSLNEALRIEQAANTVGNLRALRRVAMQHPEKARTILRVLKDAVRELEADMSADA
ncbi:ParB/RepB/Spo0J family partition protein [Nonomuraea sp. NPDC050202]|uniref:ParB/RepB/Spo0J family partition protein n=1 Tax=Nonomuraea sp. NPDC050202 TaxID=3155035 RepID=UPI0033FBDD26